VESPETSDKDPTPDEVKAERDSAQVTTTRDTADLFEERSDLTAVPRSSKPKKLNSQKAKLLELLRALLTEKSLSG